MSEYPVLEIYEDRIYENAVHVMKACHALGIYPCAVTKGFCNEQSVIRALLRAGFDTLASSRIQHLRELRESNYPVSTFLIRIPMKSELEEVIACCDVSLESEKKTIEWLNEEAGRQKKVHKIVLMRDVGDLREGIYDVEEFIQTAVWVHRECKNLSLHGIGTNLTCYGSVTPTTKNLGELCGNAKRIEQLTGKKLTVISGGGTTSTPLIVNRTMPAGINHLRLGEALILPFEWGCNLEGMREDTLILKAQIVELNKKPTVPVGERGRNSFGNYRSYEDRGERWRAILAVGEYDYGNYEKLKPCDPQIQVLGASSDHTILDIHDCKRKYELGDIISFQLSYQPMLFLTSCPLVRKKVVRGV